MGCLCALFWSNGLATAVSFFILLGYGIGKLSQQGCTEKTTWETQLEQNIAAQFAGQGSSKGRPNTVLTVISVLSSLVGSEEECTLQKCPLVPGMSFGWPAACSQWALFKILGLLYLFWTQALDKGTH